MIVQNVGGGGRQTGCIMGDVQMSNWSENDFYSYTTKTHFHKNCLVHFGSESFWNLEMAYYLKSQATLWAHFFSTTFDGGGTYLI